MNTLVADSIRRSMEARMAKINEAQRLIDQHVARALSSIEVLDGLSMDGDLRPQTDGALIALRDRLNQILEV